MLNQKTLHQIYFWGIILILAQPLLYDLPIFGYSLFYPQPWIRTIIFRIVLSILLFIFAYQILFTKNNPISKAREIMLNRKNQLFWPFWFLITLLGIYFLATLFSLEPGFSFWGSPYRAGGFVNYAFYIIFAVFLFLIFRKESWQKIWDFSFLIGILVSFSVISGKTILREIHPHFFALGNPLILSLYLLLMLFLVLSFGLNTKNKKRYFYFFCFVLFLFIIIFIASRSAFLGTFIGGLFFILFLPQYSDNIKIKKRIKLAKSLTLIIIAMAILGFWGLKENSQLAEPFKKIRLFEKIWSSIESFSIEQFSESRGDGWKVGIQGVKDRLFLGYGPGNFSIPFDKYYDSSLPGIKKMSSGGISSSWWDKGHNFLIDHLSDTGIAGLATYLLLFITLFWKLQKTKNFYTSKYRSENFHIPEHENQKKDAGNAVIIHGIQATFIAYFITLFFSFDMFSTHLMSFVLIGYSFLLIQPQSCQAETETEQVQHPENKIKSKTWKHIFIFTLFIVLVIFIYNYNLRPLYANKKANEAMALTIEENGCKEAIKKMENIMDFKTIIDNHVRLQYYGITAKCVGYDVKRYKLPLSYKVLEILEENMETRPYYTRNYQFAGLSLAKIIEEDEKLLSQDKQELGQKGYAYFEKAIKLSPKRAEIYIDRARLSLALEDFDLVQKDIDKCIGLNQYLGNCWWVKAVMEINMGEIELAKKDIETAGQKGYFINRRGSVAGLINVYSKMAEKTGELKYYQELALLYPKLIKIDPKDFQFHASLAFVYKELGHYAQAREETIIVLKMSPISRSSVEEFIKSLPYPYNSIDNFNF